MTVTFEQLDDAGLSNNRFWSLFADAVLDSGTGIGKYNVLIRNLLTKERCLDVAARFGAMTDEEVAWMGKKKRRGKPVRVYRAAPIGEIAAFRFHTSVDHALADLPEGTIRGHLLIGEVDVDSIILRLMPHGAKLVIASPDRVRAIQVNELMRADTVGVEEAEDLRKVEELTEVEPTHDVLVADLCDIGMD